MKRITKEKVFEMANNDRSGRFYKIYYQWCILEDIRLRNKYKAEVRCYQDDDGKYHCGICFDLNIKEL